MRASVRPSAHPLYVSRKDVPGNLIETEREIYKAQVTGKPANVVDKIVDGKLEKFVAPSVCSSRVLSKTPIKPSATCSRPRSPSSAKTS